MEEHIVRACSLLAKVLTGPRERDNERERDKERERERKRARERKRKYLFLKGMTVPWHLSVI